MKIIFVSKDNNEVNEITATNLTDTTANWVATVSGSTVTRAKADWVCFIKNE